MREELERRVADAVRKELLAQGDCSAALCEHGRVYCAYAVDVEAVAKAALGARAAFMMEHAI